MPIAHGSFPEMKRRGDRATPVIRQRQSVKLGSTWEVQMGELMSQRRYASTRGLSRTAVRKQIELGIIPVAPDGKIDAEAADRARAENLDPSRGGKQPTPADAPEQPASNRPPGYATSRAIREAYNAENARLQYEERVGMLTPTKDVADAQFAIARIVRDRIQALPRRLAPMIAALADEREVEEALDKEVGALLDDLVSLLEGEAER